MHYMTIKLNLVKLFYSIEIQSSYKSCLPYGSKECVHLFTLDGSKQNMRHRLR